MRLRSSLSAFMLILVAATAFALVPDLGPEWTRKGPYYQRTAEVPVMRYVGGDEAAYKIKLAHDEVSVGEIDDNLGFNLRSSVGSLEVTKKHGSVASIKIVLGKIRYFDLNADGVLDSMSDSRETQPRVFIFLEDRLVRIANSLLGGNVERARSFEGDERFEFKSGKWRIAE